MRTLYPIGAVFSVASFLTATSAAQPLVTVETVAVGDAGNAADARSTPGAFGYGAVDYRYRIGKFEVTIGQYAAFLNAVAQSDPYGLYNTNMRADPSSLIGYLTTSAAASSGIQRDGSSGSFSYTVIGPLGSVQIPQATASNRPITFVSWFDAARFCNWMHNGATVGADTETGAYTLINGQTNGIAPAKNPGAKWWIPTENEWYKAAYFKGEGRGTNAGYWWYATQSDTVPGNLFFSGATNNANVKSSGGGRSWYCVADLFLSAQNYLTDVGSFSNAPSSYGTFDQLGNVEEWNDLDGSSGSIRGIRGASWTYGNEYANASIRSTNTPSREDSSALGFRLAAAANPLVIPLISSSTTASNGFSMSWTPASEVTVQRRASLSEGAWTTILRGVTNGSYLDAAPPAGLGFYRLYAP